MIDHGKLLYVLERVGARGSEDVLHTHEGGDCHAECVKLANDGLVEDVADDAEQARGHHMWRVLPC